MDVSQRLSFFASLFRVDQNPTFGMWLLYLLIFILSVIVYKLGFATKLPLLKSLIIYIFLALGCTLLTFLGIFLPVAEGLAITAFVLILFKIRMFFQKRHETNVH